MKSPKLRVIKPWAYDNLLMARQTSHYFKANILIIIFMLVFCELLVENANDYITDFFNSCYSFCIIFPWLMIYIVELHLNLYHVIGLFLHPLNFVVYISSLFFSVISFCVFLYKVKEGRVYKMFLG